MVSETESPPPLLGPRVSFSDDGDVICISPVMCKEADKDNVKGSVKVVDFEFLSENVSPRRMLTADELFSDGKFIPFREVNHSQKLKNITFKKEEDEEEDNKNRVSWFLDEDPSPRPPKCTVLWKELLRLKKQRNHPSLSPSSSTSSSSSLENAAKKGCKKRLEKTRSTRSMKIRPMVHVPICTHSKSSVSSPPLFPLKKNRAEKL